MNTDRNHDHMTVSDLIAQLEGMPQNAEVIIQLENQDDLPLRVIGQIAQWQGSDGPIDTDTMKYQDQVRIKTAIAHLNPVVFKPMKTMIETTNGVVYHTPRKIVDVYKNAQNEWENNNLVTVYDANRDHPVTEGENWIVAAGIFPNEITAVWEAYLHMLEQPIACDIDGDRLRDEHGNTIVTIDDCRPE